MYRNVPEMYRYFWQMSKMYRNFRQMSKMLKITINFQNFRHFRYILGSKNGQNGSKNGRKLRKLYRNFRLLPKMTDFRRFDKCRKCTKIFVFRLSVFPVHFPEKTRNPKTVTETHGLTWNVLIVTLLWMIKYKIAFILHL